MRTSKLTSLVVFALITAFISAPVLAGEIADLHRKYVRPKEGDNQAEQQRFEELMDNPKHGITEIGIERTACFGDCPVYTLIIQSDGKFRYHGEQHVEKIGKHVGAVDPWEFQQLALYAKEMGYMNLKSTYTVPVTDMPTTYTTITMNGKRKLISNYGGVGPAKLWAFEKLVDQLLHTAKWGPDASFDFMPDDIMP